MESKRDFVQISIEEYDNLKTNSRTLEQIVNSEKCLEISSAYSYDLGCNVYVANPIPDIKELLKTLQEESLRKQRQYIDWLNKDKNKKIKIWHIGKTVKEIID